MRGERFSGRNSGPAERTATDEGQPEELRSSRPASPGLRVLFSECVELEGAVFPIREGSQIIGRELTFLDARKLSDSRVSARHLLLSGVTDEATVRIRDLESRNGSFVNAQPVREAVLTESDLLRIGGTLLQLVHDVLAVDSDEPNDDVAHNLVGPSVEMRRLRRRVRELARLEANVLLLGPPGCGKERAAHALHAARGEGPLVCVNCAALAEGVAPSELFGHTRGAFTGADEARLGAFRRSHGGTLFLDEVTELPENVQPMLLRALQDGEIRPVGGDRGFATQVRVVSATNRDVSAAVRCGRLRADLYSRLAGAVLHLPPLRGRLLDIVALSQQFLGEGRRFHTLAMEELLLQPWPNNVRDLQGVIHLLDGAEDPVSCTVQLTEAARDKMRMDRAASTSVADDAIPVRDAAPVTWPSTVDERVQLLERLLERCHGNISEVARLLGKRATSVRRWLASYGVDHNRYRR